ncbi:gp53-like domain-containing protein [Megasphaera elsdenii]|uniref:gp53-like domain-containing protein n=1 Tax=Megasphaera elsdenii TaxID=907 RepID=UPI003C6DAD7E
MFNHFWFVIQWVTYVNINGLSSVTYPIAFKNVPLMAITSEADPAGWDNNINGIAIAGADLKTASNIRMNVLSKWIINGGTIKRDGQAVRLILMGI